MKIILTVLIFTLSIVVYSDEVPSSQQLQNVSFANIFQKQTFSGYTTGREFCTRFAQWTSSEAGFWLSVPVDPNDASLGNTDIYGYWADGFFNPSLPVMLFFDGGPGGNSHGYHRLTSDYNELHFDQRGTACSRPSALALYMNPRYYSSEFEAFDAEKILDYLRIDKVSVLGISYGSVTATIFASKYPSRVNALVLEGVMYSFLTADNEQVLVDGFNQLFQSLPQETQAAITKSFPDGDQTLGFKLQMLMYGDGSFDTFKSALLKYYPDPDHIDATGASAYFDFSGSGQLTERDAMRIEDHARSVMIGCKEGYDTQLGFQSVFVNKGGSPHMEFQQYPMDQDSICFGVGVPANPKPYLASDYPVSVPMTYFQGLWDGATSPAGALKHFTSVPKGPVQFIEVQKGGHSSLWGDIQNTGVAAGTVSSARSLLNQGLQGKPILQAILDQMNASQSITVWQLVSPAP